MVSTTAYDRDLVCIKALDQRAITQDETVYSNPEAFDPDRFLDPTTPPSPVFGWGRRYVTHGSAVGLEPRIDRTFL